MSAHANSCEVAIMSSLLGMAWADLTRGLGLFIVWTVLDCTHGMAWHVYKQTWSWSHINMRSKRMGRIGPEPKTKMKNRGCFLSFLDLLATLLCSNPILFSFSSAREQGNRLPDMNMT